MFNLQAPRRLQLIELIVHDVLNLRGNYSFEIEQIKHYYIQQILQKNEGVLLSSHCDVRNIAIRTGSP